MAEDEAVVDMTKEDEAEKVSAAIASVTANRPGVTISIATVNPATTSSSVTLTKATAESRTDDDDGEDEDEDENGSPGNFFFPNYPLNEIPYPEFTSFRSLCLCLLLTMSVFSNFVWFTALLPSTEDFWRHPY
jgi:hypothetical protein